MGQKALRLSTSLAIIGIGSVVPNKKKKKKRLIVEISYYLLNLVQETPSMLCCSDTRFRKRPRDQNQP